MFRTNYMQENIHAIGNLIAERTHAPLQLKTLRYVYGDVPSDFGDQRGPGLLAKFETGNRCKVTAGYPISEYPDLETLEKAINFDAFFSNITLNHPHLGVSSCDYARDIMRVDVGSRVMDIHDFRRFYDVDACVLHVDKYIQAVNEALQALRPKNEEKKQHGFLHFKPKAEVFSPGYTGDVDIKAPFSLEEHAVTKRTNV